MPRYQLFCLICFSVIVIGEKKFHPITRFEDVVSNLKSGNADALSRMINITSIFNVFNIFGGIKNFMTNTLNKFTNLLDVNIVPSILGDLTSALRKTYESGTKMTVGALVEMFKQIINKFSLSMDPRKLMYESFEMGKTAMLCNGCQVFFGLSIFLFKDLGVDPKMMIECYVTICMLFKNKDFCEGVVTLQTPSMFYIIQNKNVNEKEICAIWLQWLGCTGDVPQWNITLNGNLKPEKPKGIYSGKSKKILQITDIHYDPLYRKGSVANCRLRSICCQKNSIVKLGEAVLPARHWAESSNCDINKRFIKTTLKHIARKHRDVSYIYFTGDIVTHRIWDTTIMDNSRAIKKIHRLMRKHLPKVPIFSILGNHEPHPLNLFTPEVVNASEFNMNWLFKLYRCTIPPLIRGFAGDVATIRRGGYYNHLVEPGFRVISINSNPAFVLNWWLLYDSKDPYGQLEWLKNALDRAEFNNEAVHILSHIPCSDGFSFVVWCREFKRIVSRYSNTIMSIFNGHTHLDEMIIYHSEENPQKPVSIAWNGGSITPYDFNNPNYRIYDVDSETFEIIDYTDYYVDLERANNNKKVLVWGKLYSFKEEYAMQNLTPHAMRDLVYRLANDKELLKAYFRNRMKGAPLEAPCSKDCQRRILCSFLKGDFHDDRQCKEVLG